MRLKQCFFALVAMLLCAFSATAQVTTEAALKEALTAGGEVTLGADITTTAAITTSGVTSVIDLNGKTLTIGAGDNKFYDASDITIKNGTISITGVTVGGNAIFCLDEYEKTLVTTLTLDNVNLVGEGYSSAYCIFYIGNSSVLNVKGGVWNLKNDASAAGGVFKGDASAATLNIDGLQLTAHNVRRVVTYAATTIANSTLAISGDADGVDAEMEHGFNRSPLAISNSTITMTDMVGRGITAENGAVTISGNSTVTMTNCQEATIDVRNGQTVTIDNTSTVAVDKEPTISSGSTISGTVKLPVVAKIGDVEYSDFAAALTAASKMSGDVTVEVYDKVTLNTAFSGSYSSINFVGKDTDAEIYLDVQGYITATGKKVSFTDLTLSKSEGDYLTNAGFMNVAFGIYDVVEVTYTNCVFANGAYASSGNVTYTGCTFKKSWEKYGLWAYGNVNVAVEGCKFDNDRGIKMYAEDKAKTTDLTVRSCDFSALTGKPAIVLTYGESVVLEGNTYSSTGTFELDLDGAPNGTAVTSDVAPTCKNDNGTCGVLVDGKIYTTVAQAAEVAAEGSNVTLLYSTTDAVEFAEGVNLTLADGVTAENVTVKVSGPVEVATYDQLVAALANGGNIKLTADITVDTKITAIDGTELDLNEKTLYINVENSYYNNVTIKNGNIVLGKDDVTVCDGYFLVNAGKTLVLNGVNMSSSAEGIKGYAVFHLYTGANLDLINSTLNIADNEYSAGYIVYAGEATATVDIVKTTITGSKVNGIVHATTVIDESTVTLTNVIEHGINRSGVTIDDSNVAISGGTGRGITAQHGDLVITGNSTVDIKDMGEATIELRNDKNLSVAETATVTLDAAVNNTTNGTISGTYDVQEDKVELPEVVITDIKESLKDSDPDLTFALNFAIKDIENLTEEYLEKLFAQYGDWYTDYVLTISGLTDENVTFNANGNGDGYLAGQYDAWSENWVSVPFEDVTLANGASIYIMEYAAKLMNKQGLRFTLAEVAEIVQNFDCGVYFTPEFLAANPGLKVDLHLKVFTEDAEGNKVNDINVATNNFDIEDYVAIVHADGKQTAYCTTLAEAVAAADADETITLIADVELTETLNIPAGKTVALDLNGKTVSMADASGAAAAMIKNNGTLTVNDLSTGKNGKLTFATTTPSAANAYASNTISNYGTIIIEAGTIENASETGGACYALDNYAGSTATINGGKLTATKTTVRIFNWTNGDANKATLNVNGGEIYSKDGYAINVNSGNAPSVALNITGGTITTDDTDYSLAVYVVNKGTAENFTADVTGGTFNGYFALNGVTSTTMAEEAVSISGGTFDGVICYEEPAYGFVTGGTYNEDVNDYCAEGFVCEANEDGTYGVVADPSYIAELVIDDAAGLKYENTVEKTVGTLTYKRTLAMGVWNPLYVPFEVSVDDLVENYEIAYYNQMLSHDNDNDGVFETFDMEIAKLTTGTVIANYPLFIKPRTEDACSMEYVLEDATLYAAKEYFLETSSASNIFKFHATYQGKSKADLEGYLTVGMSGWTTPSADLKPGRMYLQILKNNNSPFPTSPAKSVRFVVNGEDGTTGVEEITGENGEEMIFDLQGRRVLEPQKGGLYIVNGKKVLVK